MDMKQATRLFMLSVMLSALAPSSSSAGGRYPPPATLLGAQFSADNFDWREMVPYLFTAATLPGEQGIKAILENSSVLRAYVANEVQTDCERDEDQCSAKGELESEVSKRIDDIAHEEIFRRHKTATVDYPLTRRPFPFSEIAALKSENHRDAYLILALADHSYTAAQVQAKYGDPYDTDIFQWYGIFKYKLDRPGYTSKAVFEIDPVDGAVIKVAISLKLKKPKNGR
jgi:hypothetical protein